MRRVALAVAIAVPLAILVAAGALGAVYRGAGTNDPEMPVKVTVSDKKVDFSYSDVLVHCSDGSQVRQGGAVHSARLNGEGKFKDTLDVEGEDESTIDFTTSIVRGHVTQKKAWGTVAYELEYDGGDCHSSEVHWTAKRRP